MFGERMREWGGWDEVWSCTAYFVLDIITAAGVAWRLFSVGTWLATVAGICILVSGIGFPAMGLTIASKWRAANPDNPAPVGRVLQGGLAAVSCILLFFLIYLVNAC